MNYFGILVFFCGTVVRWETTSTSRGGQTSWMSTLGGSESVDQLASITESLRTGVPNSAQVQQLQIQELPRTVLPSPHYNPYTPADQGLSQRGFTGTDTITRGPEQLVLEGERTANTISRRALLFN
ncbi:hypothetical protein BGX38DRAFT_1144855 [Terfezia claveryi]|nr:hypothetical protein BGX38DRAFT_1144855 [Terfezia claveryi]